MTKPVVCIDVDNVLADYTEGLREYVRERYGDQYPCPDPVAYDFSLTPGWPFSGSVREYLDDHRKAVCCYNLYIRLDAYEGAAENVTRLHDDGYRIIISTSRMDDGDDTRRWLLCNDIPYDGLHHGLKTDINYRILIDDKPDVLEDCSHRAGIILHPDFQYCRNAPGLAYHTWEDVPRLIREHEDTR